jgi:hypothetical protein
MSTLGATLAGLIPTMFKETKFSQFSKSKGNTGMFCISKKVNDSNPRGIVEGHVEMRVSCKVRERREEGRDPIEVNLLPLLPISNSSNDGLAIFNVVDPVLGHS